MNPSKMRRSFFRQLSVGLHVVWPVLSILLGLMIALGLVIGRIEGWSLSDSVYFTFVSGLTIGYGDLAPKLFSTRILAVCMGVCGVLFTALVAAIAVKALTTATEEGGA